MTLRLPVVLLLCCVAAAGALASPGPPAAATFGFSSTLLDAGDYLNIDRGRDVSLALDPAGRAVVSYLDSLSDDLKVLHCGDAACLSGNTITTPDTDIVSGKTSLAIDAAGFPVVAYDRLRVLHCGDAACAGGNTIAMPDPSGFRGSLTLDAAGRPVVSYSSSGSLKVLRCGDTTCTAGNTITTPDPGGTGTGGQASLALDAAGNPVVAYQDRGSFHADLKVLHCGDPTCTAGNTITVPDTAEFVGRHPSLAMDSAGRPVVSYYSQFDRELKVLRCGDPNCTAGNTIAVPDTFARTTPPGTAIALDSADRPVIIYQDPMKLDLRLLRCGNPTCTSGNTITSPDAAGQVGKYSSLTLDGADVPVVAYYASGVGQTEDLRLLYCGNPTCEAGNTIVSPDTTPGLPTAGDVGEWSSIALDAAGNPVVSYYDSGQGDLKVLHCGDPACVTGNTIAAPDVHPSVGLNTSLALDSAGRPVVSYQGLSEGERALKILRCGDPACASGNVISNFASARVADSTSLALGAADNPIVAYHSRETNQQSLGMKLLHCGDPACTSGNSITTLDPSSAPQVSLALDSAGNPIIAYPTRVSPSDLDLGVVHCGNPDCTAGNTFGVIEIAGDEVEWISMALDPSGNPVIAFHAQFPGWLFTVVHCSDPACVGPFSLEHPGAVASGISLAIASDGNPVLSMGGRGIFFCGDPNCSAGNRLAFFGTVGSHTSLALTDQDMPVVSYDETSGNDLEILCCIPPDLDTDQDGCTNVAEKGTIPGAGGLRDFNYFWDFYDVWTHPPGDAIGWERDKVVTLAGDILGVARRFGQGTVLSKEDALAAALTPPTDESGYHPAFDRGPVVGPNDWDVAPADGAINLPDDILGVARQFGHSCL